MFQGGKYGNFLTILLVIIIIAVVGLIAYFGYDVYKKVTTEQEANEFVTNFGQEIKPTDTTPSTDRNDEDDEELTEDEQNSLDNVDRIETDNSSSTGDKQPTFQGLPVAGTIEIPAINLSYPIIAEPSKTAIEKAVAMLCGPGPNQPGNTVIIGHNYRNGKFFSNNKNLSKGDKIYITDLTGKKLTYTIYDKFETTDNDTDFIVRSTNGAREISLQTCTDDGAYRLIIVAKCDLDNN